MDKDIIIDGVNVAECRHLSFVEEDYCCDCQYEKYAPCQSSDCYYKQSKRLQAENEQLKETNLQLQTIDMEIDRNNKYRKALEEIRKIAEKRNYLNLDEALDDILDKINEVLE